jgi:hypothetical protein
VILYVEMRKQIIQNTSKQKYIFSAFAYFNTIRVLTARGCKYYNTNLENTLFKITLSILVILYVEMGLQMSLNSSKLKLCVNLFQRYSYHKGSRTP